MADEITEIDVIKALQDAMARQEKALDGYYTRRELEDLTGWSSKKVYDVLHKLSDQGRLESRKKTIETIAGTQHPVPAYKILMSQNGRQPEGVQHE